MENLLLGVPQPAIDGDDSYAAVNGSGRHGREVLTARSVIVADSTKGGFPLVTRFCRALLLYIWSMEYRTR